MVEDYLYTDRGPTFTGFAGAYAALLSTEKNSIWGMPIGNSVQGHRPRPVHLVRGAYGDVLGPPGRFRDPKQMFVHKKFTKNFHEMT